jgi:cold shock protein
MQGTVKWFSNERGYGFVVGADGIERYFNVRGVKGVSLPRAGASVTFAPASGLKGPAAEEIEILNQPEGRKDDRIACPHCTKRIVPRIVIARGVLTHSVCPFCGGQIKQFYSVWPSILAMLGVLIAFVIVGWNS